MNKNILIVASAGGHLTQAMCAASNIDEVVLVSNKLKINEEKIIKKYKVWDTQFNPVKHLYNFLVALVRLKREKIYVVFSTGGPIAIPYALAAKLLGVKFVYLDTLSRVVELSNTGKFLDKFRLYDDFYVQWRGNLNHDKHYIGKCFDITNKNYHGLADGDKANQSDKEKIIVLVTLGTCDYKFNRVFDTLNGLEIYHDERVEWIIQKGNSDIKHKPKNCKVYNILERDELEEYVRKSSLVISHCGIGSINLNMTYNKKVFYVPRLKENNEFSDNHQLQIAKELPKEIVIYKEDTLEVSYCDLVLGANSERKKDIVNRDFSEKIAAVLNGYR